MHMHKIYPLQEKGNDKDKNMNKIENGGGGITLFFLKRFKTSWRNTNNKPK